MRKQDISLTNYNELLGKVSGRLMMASMLGLTYGGARDLYSALGYKKELTFLDYWTQYTRQDIAAALINRPCNATWHGAVSIMNPGTADGNDELQKKYDSLEWKLKLKSAYLRVDKLAAIGGYAVLLLGFSDVARSEDFSKEVSKSTSLELRYVTPFSVQAAKIHEYETDTSSPRYGLPKVYQISSSTTSGLAINLLVHHSRIIHVVGEALESDVLGVPYMRDVFNRLTDCEKLAGGSAEMFWRGARPGMAGAVDKDASASPTLKDDLNAQWQEYENGLRRVMLTEGVTLNSLQTQVADPLNHVDVQISLIAAAKGIPKRVLTGSEKAELASSQDRDAWIEFIDNRRTEIAEPQILGALVDRLMLYGILPMVPRYTITWTPLVFSNEQDKANVGKTRTEALVAYNNAQGIGEIMPLPLFLEMVIGFSSEQVERITSYLEDMALSGTEEEIEKIINPTKEDNV